MRLLLLSNSRNPGGGWLDHAAGEIRDFFGPPGGRLLFVPFAAVTMSFKAYSGMARKRFSRLGYSLQEISKNRIDGAAGIVVGGGNTFRLLHEMRERGLLDRVARRVRAGVPYMGWSAGSNLACPTIRTTNDMPVVAPRSLAALDLVPFQLNPHYTERTIARHGGESRDQRIAEFLTMNSKVKVLGLREGSLLRLEHRKLTLRQGPGAALFQNNKKKIEIKAGTDLSFLLRR